MMVNGNVQIFALENKNVGINSHTFGMLYTLYG